MIGESPLTDGFGKRSLIKVVVKPISILGFSEWS